MIASILSFAFRVIARGTASDVRGREVLRSSRVALRSLADGFCTGLERLGSDALGAIILGGGSYAVGVRLLVTPDGRLPTFPARTTWRARVTSLLRTGKRRIQPSESPRRLDGKRAWIFVQVLDRVASG